MRNIPLGYIFGGIFFLIVFGHCITLLPNDLIRISNDIYVVGAALCILIENLLTQKKEGEG
jgi:hypothetical protein